MLEPVKDDTFQRGTAQHTIAPIKPRTPRATHTIWTPTDPILQKDKVEKIHEEMSTAAPLFSLPAGLLLFVELCSSPAYMQTFLLIRLNSVFEFLLLLCRLIKTHPVHLSLKTDPGSEIQDLCVWGVFFVHSSLSSHINTLLPDRPSQDYTAQGYIF